jgi:hypothetical protein
MFQGVIDPVPPSVDQCIQVIVDPLQDELADLVIANKSLLTPVSRKALAEDKWPMYMAPRNVVTITNGKSWKPLSGVKRGREQSPVMPVTAFCGTDLDVKSSSGYRVAGVTIDGIHNGMAACQNPNAAARMSVQMHGVATVFCPQGSYNRDKSAKFGDPVYVELKTESSNERTIRGHNESFTAFNVVVGKTPIEPALFLGWLVDLGPPDRNELRVHLDQHYGMTSKASGALPSADEEEAGESGPVTREEFDKFKSTEGGKVANEFIKGAAEGKGEKGIKELAELLPDKRRFGFPPKDVKLTDEEWRIRREEAVETWEALGFSDSQKDVLYGCWAATKDAVTTDSSFADTKLTQPASAPGVAVAALAVAASMSDSPHPIPHGVALASKDMTPDEMRKQARIAESQEMHGKEMDHRRLAALMGDGTADREVAERTAVALSNFYENKPQDTVPTAAMNINGALTTAVEVTDEVLSMTKSEHGGAPQFLVRQTDMATGNVLTSPAAALLPDSLQSTAWPEKVTELLTKYKRFPAVSDMTDEQITTLQQDARATLQ